MKKIKNFITGNKITIISVVILLILLFAAHIILISQPGIAVDKQPTETTSKEETVKENKTESFHTDSKPVKEPSLLDNISDDNIDNSIGSTDSTPSDKTENRHSNSGESSQSSQSSSHQHNWKEHTTQRWVPNIVTVIDQPEQTKEYSIYRIYWYNTGTWEETRDPARFKVWSSDKIGGALAPNSITMVKNPENCPLFTGYNDLGQPVYTGDHAIIGPYYETIPAVTHEEDHGHNEIYVDYYYCDCGATK